ncbi:MarR family transcriptional regulator [Paramicrobacterium agarici]|nr:MarR family transcriptional regulator [Microbacterium agarici]
MHTTTFDRPARPPIGLLLRTLDRLLDERFERTLGIRDISRRQWQLLNTLARRPATSNALTEAVAPFLDTSESAEQHLDPLKQRGLVAVNDDVYELTDAGRRTFDDLAREVQVTRELTVRGLPEGEYERTIATLQRMVENLEPV